jgi:hypothetical protein
VILDKNQETDSDDIIDSGTNIDDNDSDDEEPDELTFPIPTEMSYVHTPHQLYTWSESGFLEIGSFTLEDNTQPSITDIAINSAGEVYAVSTSSLYRVNIETAQISLIGSLSQALFGLAFDASGDLYGIGNGLFIVNIATSGLIPIPLDISVQTTGDIVGLSDGTLMCFMDNPAVANGDLIIQISPHTGTTTTLFETEYEQFTGVANIYDTILAFSSNGDLLLIDLNTGEVEVYVSDVLNISGASENPLF